MAYLRGDSSVLSGASSRDPGGAPPLVTCNHVHKHMGSIGYSYPALARAVPVELHRLLARVCEDDWLVLSGASSRHPGEASALGKCRDGRLISRDTGRRPAVLQRTQVYLRILAAGQLTYD